MLHIRFTRSRLLLVAHSRIHGSPFASSSNEGSGEWTHDDQDVQFPTLPMASSILFTSDGVKRSQRFTVRVKFHDIAYFGSFCINTKGR